MTITFRPGRLDPHPASTHPRLRMLPFVAPLDAAPASVDWYSAITIWPMYLNDEIGDCTEAMVGHKIENASMYGDGSVAAVDVDDILAAYERVSGYRPGHPETDNGAVLQDVYNDWRKVGVGGHKILAFGEVDVTNLAEVKTVIHTFGALGLGIVVDQRMMDDFNAGRGWSRTGGPQLGGHAVPAVGYDADGVWVVTWATVIKMAWSVFREVAEEGWVAVLPEWINDASGKDPLDVDLYGLGEAMSDLTGDPNPFPQPTPTPPPTPDPDEELAGCLSKLLPVAERWLANRKGKS